jgi:cellulose biosynthesis protein BcsQ
LIIEDLKKIKKDINVHILLNNISPSATTLVKDLKEFLLSDNEGRFDMIKGIMRQRSDYRKSFEYGKSVVEMNPDSKAANEIKLIIKNIKEILEIQ